MYDPNFSEWLDWGGGGGSQRRPCCLEMPAMMTRCLLGVHTPVIESQVISKWDLWVSFLDWVGFAPADFAGSGLDTLASKIRQQSRTAASSIMDGNIRSGQLQQVREAGLLQVD